MPQADLNVANQSGLAFRQDLNNQLLALGTLQSGSSAPSTTYAYMLWADTSTSPATIRMRNGANNAWIVVGTSDTTNLGLLPAATAASTYAPLTGTGASGTWPISISGNAATATTAATANTLSGAGPLSATDYTYTADFPNVRPSLLLDFANSKTLDPRVSFSRASTGTYVGADGLIKTAAINEPRFDHNGGTGESLGLLIEEARTNVIVPSNPSAAAWAPSALSNIPATSGITFNQPNSLTGGNTAASFNSGSSQLSYQLGGVNPSAISFYIRGVTSAVTVTLILPSTGTGSITVSSTYSVSLSSNGGWLSSGTATNAGNGWYRISAYINAASANSQMGISGGNSGVLLDLFQLEAGAFPTSYIPTTAATVTRSADVAQMTGTNFTSWVAQGVGTLLVNGETNYESGAENYLALHGSSFGSNRMALYVTGSGHRAYIDPPGIAPILSAQTSGVFRACIAYNATNVATSFNGSAASQTTTGSISTTFTTLSISGADSPPGLTRLARVAYYPVRLTNAQLQNLTAS